MSGMHARGKYRRWAVLCAALAWVAGGWPASGAAPAPAPAGAPRLTFVQPLFDFGAMYQQEKLTHEYAFTNTGKAPLKIREVFTSCGCAVIKQPTKEIAPGAKGSITITFDSGRLRNRVTKHFFVTSNDPVEPRVTLTLSGVVKLEVDLAPTGIYFGRLSPGQQTERTVTLTPVEVKQFKVLDVKTGDPGIALVTPRKQLKPDRTGRYSLTFRIGPYAKEQRITARVIIRTDLKHQSELPLPIYGRVAPEPEKRDASSLAP